jgi:hypothetical protein
MLDVPDSTPLIAIVNLFKYHGFVKTSIFQRSDIHCEEALDSTNGSSNSSLLALLASQCIVCLSQDVSAVPGTARKLAFWRVYGNVPEKMIVF